MYKNETFLPNEQDNRFYGIMGKYFADKKIIKEMDNQLYNTENTVWVINMDKTSNDIRGCISITDNNKYLFIDNFYVLEKYRNDGVGRTLLKEVLKVNEGQTIKLITRNEIAFRMFCSVGFETYRKNGRYYYMQRKE